jgi:hypothetical protein
VPLVVDRVSANGIDEAERDGVRSRSGFAMLVSICPARLKNDQRSVAELDSTWSARARHKTVPLRGQVAAVAGLTFL